METVKTIRPGKTGCGDVRGFGQPLHGLRVQWRIGDLNADAIAFQEPFTKNRQLPGFALDMLPTFHREYADDGSRPEIRPDNNKKRWRMVPLQQMAIQVP